MGGTKAHAVEKAHAGDAAGTQNTTTKVGDPNDVCGNMKEIENITDFNKMISENKNVVIDFTAAWCPPCTMINPEFCKLGDKGEYENVKFFKCDVDVCTECAEQAGIVGMPTFQFF